MRLELASCSDVAEKLAMLAVLLQGFELRLLARAYETDGVWTPRLFAREFEHTFLALIARWTSSPRVFRLLVILQIFAAVVGLLLPRSAGVTGPCLLILFAIVLVVAARWRGAFNGGADSMTLIVLLCLTVGEFGGSERVWRSALWYIALQVVLSFFLSGLAKLRRADWRDGRALANFLRIEKYGAPAPVARLAGHSRAVTLLGWIVVLFECAFPLALVGPRAAAWFVAAGVLFNLVNFWLIGLNRFVFAWAAAYPAVLFCAGF